MKTKYTLTAALLFTFIFCQSQQPVPNGGFETWSSLYSPTRWTSFEDIIPGIGGLGLSGKDMSDKYEGSSSVILSSKYLPLINDTVAGVIIIGTGAFIGGDPQWYGTPFLSSPDTLQFDYKYSPAGSDTALFEIKLHKAGSNTYKLQYSSLLLSTYGQWTRITIPLKQFYNDITGTTDTLLLAFRSSYRSGWTSLHPRQGSVLHIDGVHFGYYNGIVTDIYTIGHDPLSAHDFNLYGALNSHGDTVDYSFVYSTDSTFATSTTTPVQKKRFDSLEVVYTTLKNLSANSTYYYYLHVASFFGSANGSRMSFFSDTINPIFENAGGDVTPGMGWVQLNGRFSKFHSNLALSFEYGETPALGKKIIPSDVTNVTDSLTHYFRAFPDSILPNKLYFFRAKAANNTDSFYTDIRGFCTCNTYSLHQSLPTTGITDSSADINGHTRGFPVPVKLKVEVFNNSLNYHFHSPFEYHDPDYTLINYQFHKTGLLPGTTYNVRYKADTWVGNFYSEGDFTTTGGTIGLNKIDENPNLFAYPNPAFDLITFITPSTSNSQGTLEVYKFNGQMHKQLKIPAGENEISFSTADMAAGIYLVRWINRNIVVDKKVVIIK